MNSLSNNNIICIVQYHLCFYVMWAPIALNCCCFVFSTYFTDLLCLNTVKRNTKLMQTFLFKFIYAVCTINTRLCQIRSYQGELFEVPLLWAELLLLPETNGMDQSKAKLSSLCLVLSSLLILFSTYWYVLLSQFTL